MELIAKGETPIIRELEVITTDKQIKKARVNLRVTNDDLRRYSVIWKRIEEIYNQYKPTILGLEAYRVMTGAGGGSSWKAAVVYGEVLGFGFSKGMYVSPSLPTDIKKRFCGVQSASKLDVEIALEKQVIGLEQALEAIPVSKREHTVDAACHAILALEEVCSISDLPGVSTR